MRPKTISALMCAFTLIACEREPLPTPPNDQPELQQIIQNQRNIQADLDRIARQQRLEALYRK